MNATESSGTDISGLLNRCRVYALPWVRIPPLPPNSQGFGCEASQPECCAGHFLPLCSVATPTRVFATEKTVLPRPLHVLALKRKEKGRGFALIVKILPVREISQAFRPLHASARYIWSPHGCAYARVIITPPNALVQGVACNPLRTTAR